MCISMEGINLLPKKSYFEQAIFPQYLLKVLKLPKNPCFKNHISYFQHILDALLSVKAELFAKK